jgi:hypothetical protein
MMQAIKKQKKVLKKIRHQKKQQKKQLVAREIEQSSPGTITASVNAESELPANPTTEVT